MFVMVCVAMFVAVAALFAMIVAVGDGPQQ